MRAGRAHMGLRLGYALLMAGVLTIILGMALTGCRAAKSATTTMAPTVTLHDTVSQRHVTVTRLDTVWLTLPAQTAERTLDLRTSGLPGFRTSALAFRDTVSHLETDYAVSDARISADGILTHTLANKARPAPALAPLTVDTIYTDRVTERPVPTPYPVEVEAPLTWWQRTRLRLFPWLAAVAIAAVGVAVWRVWKWWRGR